ncbi:hypothetical protein ACP2AU_07095 [Marinobacter sp. VGCF2001]
MSPITKRFLLVSSVYLFTPSVDALSQTDNTANGVETIYSITEMTDETQPLIDQYLNQNASPQNTV